MSAFSRIRAFSSGFMHPFNRSSFVIFLTALLIVMGLTPVIMAPGAIAQTRMAGAKSPVRADNTALAVLDSYGTLDTARDQALGLDLWARSDYEDLLSLIKALPPLTSYSSLNQLLRRALLTTADARQIKNRPRQAPDEIVESFYNARLEQLLKMGAFSDAAALYLTNPLPPASKEQAQAGIIALLLNDQVAMACLEGLALKGFDKEAFGKDLRSACRYLMLRNKDKSLPKDTLVPDDISSPLINKLITDPQFRYPLAALDEFEKLTILEKALLAIDSRLDYNMVLNKDGGRIQPQTAALFLQDKNLPAVMRFGLTRASVNKGLNSVDTLSALYRDYDLSKTETGDSKGPPKGWAELAWLYQKCESAPEEKKAAYLGQALNLAAHYGMTAVVPFGFYLNTLPPSVLPPSLQPKALKVLLLADLPLAEPWVKAIPGLEENDSLSLAFITALKFHNQFSTFPINDDFSEKETGSTAQKNQVIQVLHEKLDNSFSITDYSLASGYEKPSRLTSGDDYVMPSTDLRERLGKAIDKKRRGEIVLLSILALQNTPPHKINPGVVKEVLVGLNIVGLNEDARSFAKEIALRF